LPYGTYGVSDNNVFIRSAREELPHPKYHRVALGTFAVCTARPLSALRCGAAANRGTRKPGYSRSALSQLTGRDADGSRLRRAHALFAPICYVIISRLMPYCVFPG
jgi:hypothetical protein